MANTDVEPSLSSIHKPFSKFPWRNRGRHPPASPGVPNNPTLSIFSSSFRRLNAVVIVYYCFDGAIVAEEGRYNPKTSSLDEALQHHSRAPVIKLKDMTREMVKMFIENLSGEGVLEGISPNSAQDIP